MIKLVMCGEDQHYHLRLTINQALARIVEAEKKIGRSPSEITLVAVTKKFPAEVVTVGYKAGLRHFGENYLQEAKSKIPTLATPGKDPIIWHLVGHLQSNKVKEAVKLFSWIDAVDSLKLAQKISQAASAFGRRSQLLIEVNLTGEASKFGFDLRSWGKTDAYRTFYSQIDQILRLPNICVRGLMTMPPIAEPRQNRDIFHEMKLLLKDLAKKFPQSQLKELSMGTSHDFEIAIEEGATMVRLGEVLFGPRPA